MTPNRALTLLIVVSTLIRLVVAAFLGLGNDEAYHFLYALHPAASYYDHPPMVAWVEMLGLFGMGDLSSKLALRLGFVLLFAGSTWLTARIAGRWFGAWAGFYAALALNLTGYYGLAASTFALPDGPLLFFWLLTIDRVSLAIDEPRRPGLRPWAWVGLAWGGAMLSKYHAVFLPAGTVLFCGSPPVATTAVDRAWTVPGDRDRAGDLQSGGLLERIPRLGLVRLSGGEGGRRCVVPA